MKFLMNLMIVLFSTLGFSPGYLQISDIGAVLKKVIVPTLQSQIPKENVLFDKVKKNVGVTIANNNIYIAARTGRHTGIYSVAEGTEPKSGKAKYQQPYTGMKYAFGTLELTDQAIEAAKKGDVKAIASILATEISALKDDFKLDLNRQFHGAGAGLLCLTTGTGGTTGTTITLDSNPNGGDPTEYLEAGMYINIGTSHVGTGLTVVSKTASTIVIAAGTAWADSVAVTKVSDAECMGLAGIIDDGDNVAIIQNITRSADPWANAHTYDTGATLTELNMINTYLKTIRYGGAKVAFMGPTMFSKYGSLLTSMKKTTNLKEVLSGGWKGLEFMGGQCGVMLDFDTWSGYVEFVDFGALTIAEMSEPFAWLEADAHGGILKRSASNRTIWEGTLKYYLNLVALKFKSMARMKGQTV